MRARTLQTWIARRIGVRRRLERVCTSYLLFLMVVTTKHSLEEAARFSGLHKSQFSKMLRVFKNFWPLHDGAFREATGQNDACLADLCELSKNPAPFLSSLWRGTMRP
jgi:hypothetical protein